MTHVAIGNKVDTPYGKGKLLKKIENGYGYIVRLDNGKIRLINDGSVKLSESLNEEAITADLQFTGTNGVYAFLVPYPGSIKSVEVFCDTYGLPMTSLHDRLHVTLISDEESKDIDESIFKASDYVVTPSGVEFFTGKNGRTFLFLKVNSPELSDRFNELVDAGIKSKYVDGFNPHITLIDDIALTPELQAAIDEANTHIDVIGNLQFFGEFYKDQAGSDWKLDKKESVLDTPYFLSELIRVTEVTPEGQLITQFKQSFETLLNIARGETKDVKEEYAGKLPVGTRVKLNDGYSNGETGIIAINRNEDDDYGIKPEFDVRTKHRDDHLWVEKSEVTPIDDFEYAIGRRKIYRGQNCTIRGHYDGPRSMVLYIDDEPLDSYGDWETYAYPYELIDDQTGPAWDEAWMAKEGMVIPAEGSEHIDSIRMRESRNLTEATTAGFKRGDVTTKVYSFDDRSTFDRAVSDIRPYVKYLRARDDYAANRVDVSGKYRISDGVKSILGNVSGHFDGEDNEGFLEVPIALAAKVQKTIIGESMNTVPSKSPNQTSIRVDSGNTGVAVAHLDASSLPVVGVSEDTIDVIGTAAQVNASLKRFHESIQYRVVKEHKYHSNVNDWERDVRATHPTAKFRHGDRNKGDTKDVICTNDGKYCAGWHEGEKWGEIITEDKEDSGGAALTGQDATDINGGGFENGGDGTQDAYATMGEHRRKIKEDGDPMTDDDADTSDEGGSSEDPAAQTESRIANNDEEYQEMFNLGYDDASAGMNRRYDGEAYEDGYYEGLVDSGRMDEAKKFRKTESTDAMYVITKDDRIVDDNMDKGFTKQEATAILSDMPEGFSMMPLTPKAKPVTNESSDAYFLAWKNQPDFAIFGPYNEKPSESRIEYIAREYGDTPVVGKKSWSEITKDIDGMNGTDRSTGKKLNSTGDSDSMGYARESRKSVAQILAETANDKTSNQLMQGIADPLAITGIRIDVGDKVRVRRDANSPHANREGKVTEHSPSGLNYRVEFDDGDEAILYKTVLEKLPK